MESGESNKMNLNHIYKSIPINEKITAMIPAFTNSSPTFGPTNSVGVSTINIEYKKIDPFFNINTKEDLEKAIKIMNND